MVSLRTSDGLDFDFLSSEFGQNLATYFLDNIRIYIENNSVIQSEKKYRLSPQGIMISNQILIQLIKV